MVPTDQLFCAFEGVEHWIDVSIAIQHGQPSNQGNDTDSKDQSGLDSSDGAAVSEAQPDNQI